MKRKRPAAMQAPRAPATGDAALMHREVTAALPQGAFTFHTAHGLFSADRVDDGTRLLLEHLPSSLPERVLDLGCGYGALGLPVARSLPGCALTAVDRDVLAVHCCAHNAAALGLVNVRAVPSLGYSALGNEPWDWILCNVPARIGAAALEHFVLEGARRLRTGGELRAVVIHDLKDSMASLQQRHGWDLRTVASGARHTVFALGPLQAQASDPLAIYARDQVTLPTTIAGAPTLLIRPVDISQDPAHVKFGLPLLLECLPQRTSGVALVLRGGYGAAALRLARQGMHVTATDKDLLALAFTERNLQAQELPVTLQPARFLPDVKAEQTLDLLVGELSSTLERDVALLELEYAQTLVRRGQQALWLMLETHWKRWVMPWLSHSTLHATVLAKRPPYLVVTVPGRG